MSEMDLAAKLKILSSLDPDDFEYAEELFGSDSWADLRRYLEYLSTCSKMLGEIDLQILPSNHIDGLNTRLNEIINLTDSLRKPQRLSLDPVSIKKKFVEIYSNMYQAQAGALAIGAWSLRRTDEFNELLEKSNKLLEEQITKVAEANRLLEEAAITSHADHFDKQSKEHRWASWAWLGVTGLLFGAIVLFAFYLLRLPQDAFMIANTEKIAWNLIVFKAILVSIGISAMLWCGSMYKSNRHNYIVNKHRMNALNTFHAFRDATEDDKETKSAILLQAAQCIFSPQSSGYSGKGDDGPQHPLAILQSIKDAKP